MTAIELGHEPFGAPALTRKGSPGTWLLSLSTPFVALALAGCVTPLITAEALDPSGRDILIESPGRDWRSETHPNEEHPSFSWRWPVQMPVSEPGKTASHRVVLENPYEAGDCHEVSFYVNYIPLRANHEAAIRPVSVEAPILAPSSCTVMLTYGAIGDTGFYGLIASTQDGPIREVPLNGNPYMWLLVPAGVATDAAIVGGILLGFTAGAYFGQLGEAVPLTDPSAQGFPRDEPRRDRVVRGDRARVPTGSCRRRIC